jgi:hypothetical protein
MAKRKELRLLTGSMNVLNPGDKLPAGDCMQLENFRVDQDGGLRSRAGTDYAWVLSGGQDITTLGRMGIAFYAGFDNGNLYRTGSSSPIVSGLSRQPFGIAAMNGFAWIMDRNVQGRDDGIAFTSGVPQPPTSGLTASLTSGGSNSSDANGPNGTYTYYVTFVTSIGETNPGPPDYGTQNNSPVGAQLEDIFLTNIPTSSDLTVIGRNIYRIGGVLGQAYLVTTLNDNTTTAFKDTLSDAALALEGIALEFDHDAPPAAAGVVGPYFGRLMAFSSAANVNRLWWTKPGQPQYWPGAQLATGQWVDVGDAGEAIVAISCKARLAIIYKQRSIWRLIGDPDSGSLEIAHSKRGIVGARSFASAGQLDYFGWVDGVYSTADGVSLTKVSTKLDPLFLGQFTDLGGGNLSAPVDPATISSVAMEYFSGRVFVSYRENGAPAGGNSCTLIYDEQTQNWGIMRIGFPTGGFSCFLYIGQELWGASEGEVLRLDQTMGPNSEGYVDGGPGGYAQALIFQSGFQDCGAADNPKVLSDLVIDFQTGADDGAGNNVITVELLLDNGAGGTVAAGTLNSTARAKQALTGLPDPETDPVQFNNLAIRLTCPATLPVTIYAIYLYYTVEARAANAVVTLPFAPAGGRVVQVRELQVDVDNSAGRVDVELSSDMPGNAIATRATYTIPQSSGRRPIMLPFGGQTVVEGRLFQFEISGSLAAIDVGPFQLYAARMLMRIVGTYIEGYEAAAGFVWDSMENDFSTGITHIPRGVGISLYANPIKQAREIELQIETTGQVTVTLLSDLPGNAQTVRATFVVNTASAETTIMGRRVVRLPLPAGTATSIQGRLFRLMIQGNSQFKLYEAAVEILPVGVYLEAYEAAGGAVYDSREIDLGSPKVKEARELELDIATTGATVTVYTDLPSGTMTQAFTAAIVTAGRQKVQLALPQIEGRLIRLIVTSTNSFALYDARIYLRVFGQYLTGGEGTSGAFWDSTELDLGMQSVKQFQELELDIWAYGTATVTVYTDLPGNKMVQRVQRTVGPTSGRTQIQIPLPQGQVPENYIFGRLVRVTIASSQSVKLFGARISVRPIGVYIEGYEAQAGAVWDSTPIDLGSPAVKGWDEIRFEMDSDGPVNIGFWTELPGETMTEMYLGQVVPSARSRGWATVPLPAGIEGRSGRIILSGSAGFRLYQAQVRARSVGRYIAAQNGANPQDIFRTLDFDYATERVKLFKRIELDIETDGAGPLTMTVYTNSGGSMASVFRQTYATNGARQTIKQYLPLNVRGRLMRIELTSPAAARVYHLRTWMRPVNEPNAGWSWENYPLEESTVLPEWSNLGLPATPPGFTWNDLPVEATPPQWSWAPFPVAPTEAQWNWAKVLSVEGTSDKWEWIDIPGTADPMVDE